MRNHLTKLYLLCSCIPLGEAARFLMNGPVVTVTLKDPAASEPPSSTTSSSPKLPWLDLGALSPNAVWQLTSTRPPLPNWIPNLKQIALKSGYQYHAVRRLPQFIEGTAKFSTPACDVLVQPSHQLDTGANGLTLEASRGPHWLSARFASRPKASWFLNVLQGSFLLNLPYASLSSIRIQPTLALGNGQQTAAFDSTTVTSLGSGCRIEAITGVQGRTKAVLNYMYPHPTLSILHQIDARNSIAPTIYLNTAKMMYQWNLSLRAGSSLVTKVDPTSAIYVTWTDASASGGSWVTDLKLPLEATTLKALAADIRVRRQFSF
ncbi:hypothetical protein MPSEU_000003100 [Mayamaea pseudoterrestris]|nr:hypothetical protein MPSEU_000003100 [Mayamaea pseudoterrestris]